MTAGTTGRLNTSTPLRAGRADEHIASQPAQATSGGATDNGIHDGKVEPEGDGTNSEHGNEHTNEGNDDNTNEDLKQAGRDNLHSRGAFDWGAWPRNNRDEGSNPSYGEEDWPGCRNEDIAGRTYHGHTNRRSFGDVISEATPKKAYRERDTTSVLNTPFCGDDTAPSKIFESVTRTHRNITVSDNHLLWVTARDVGDPALGNAELATNDLRALNIPATAHGDMMEAHEAISRQ